MPLNFNLPSTADNYSTQFTQNIQANQKAAAQLLDPLYAGTISNPVTGIKRVDGNNAGRFEVWNGSAWAATRINGLLYDSSGRLIFGGTASLVSPLDYPQQQMAGGTVGNVVSRFSADATGPVIIGAKSRNTTVGTFGGADVAGDALLMLQGYGDDGSATPQASSQISFNVEGTVAAGIVPGRIRFSTATATGVLTEGMRLDSEQRLLIGMTAGRTVGNVSTGNKLQVELAAVVGASVVRNTNDTGPAYFMLGKTRGTSVGSNTIVADGDLVGQIDFAAADGVNLSGRAASIIVAIDGTPGADDLPGMLMFYTSADGSDAPSRRMSIDAAGNVQIGSTSRTGKRLVVTGSAGGGNAKIWLASADNGTSTMGNSSAGIELTAVEVNGTTSKFTPALKFGATDSNVTTVNPKFGAAICGYATETWSADTSGGMGLAFWTQTDGVGAAGSLLNCWNMTQDGDFLPVVDLANDIGAAALRLGNLYSQNGRFYGKFGYYNGAGGAVTQLTSKSTAVTLDKPSGTITMSNAALAAGAVVSFTVNNSYVEVDDTIITNIRNIATGGTYSVIVDNVAAGSFRVSLRNVSAGSLSEAVIIHFGVITTHNT
jgi:hypothetical protein